MMEWKKLISPHRLGRKRDEELVISQERSPFQRDFDRIIFSSAFRRMQDKTQVFPMAESDYVRTRLTHCLETASIGRSLGTAAGSFICKNFDTAGALASDIGSIVAAAALGHDIGNPPLGHGGEEAIRYWFMRSEQGQELHNQMLPVECADFEQYEGNAHGFRVMSVLQMPDQRGGMQLTCATLGAFAKYPRGSMVSQKPPGAAGKKFNFFHADRELFAEVAEMTGLRQIAPDSYCRHPLAFLVEAADDIAYRIMDFEDAHAVNLLPYSELEEDFLEVIGEEWVKDYVNKLRQPVRKVEFMRAQVIGVLVKQSVQAFIDHQQELLDGTLEKPLIEYIPASPVLRKIEARSRKDIYNTPQVASVIAAGFELISGMLDVLVPSVNEIARECSGGPKASYRAWRMVKIMPAHYAPMDDPAWQRSAYLRLLYVLDYLAGMTDTYAVNLYKKLKGISL